MRVRPSALASACLVLVAFAFGFLAGRPSPGQAPEPPPPTVGRYQMWGVTNGDYPFVVVTDTATGRTWMHATYAKAEWQAWGPPPNR